MADAITIKRDGDKVTISVSLKAAMALSTKSGRPGTSAQARVDLGNGKDARVNLNVFQAAKTAVPQVL